MKPLLIRTEGIFPPGGYPFRDRITGKEYRDTGATFAVRVKEIIRDRQANQRLFTDQKLVDLVHVERELSEYICERLNGNPKYCVGPNALNQPKPDILVKHEALANRKCPSCGSVNLKTITCPTCTKVKVTGYECRDCGNKYSV